MNTERCNCSGLARNVAVTITSACVAAGIYVTATPGPDVPKERLSEPAWAARHEKLLKVPDRAQAKVVIVGDSIAQRLEWDQAVWDGCFGAYHPLDLGITGDTTANVLWRVDNGELDGLSPAVVAVIVGSNNTRKSNIARWSTSETSSAIVDVVQAIHRKLPSAHIIVASILPTGQWGWKEKKDAKINDLVAIGLGSGQYDYAIWIDLTRRFRQKDGKLDASLYLDQPGQVHLSERGDIVLAQALLEGMGRYLPSDSGHSQLRHSCFKDDS